MKLYQFRGFFVIQLGPGKEQNWRLGETTRVVFQGTIQQLCGRG